MTRFLFIPLMCLLSTTHAWAQACLIVSTDQKVPIRMCQQNMTIPQHLFADNFCHPQIPDRSFEITMVDECPAEAYGICAGSHTDGVGYQQSIFYYSDPNDAPVLKAYCEKVSKGAWQSPAQNTA